jgi:hypothetical protein
MNGTFIGLGRKVLEGEHGSLLFDSGVDLVDDFHLDRVMGLTWVASKQQEQCGARNEIVYCF